VVYKLLGYVAQGEGVIDLENVAVIRLT